MLILICSCKIIFLFHSAFLVWFPVTVKETSSSKVTRNKNRNQNMLTWDYTYKQKTITEELSSRCQRRNLEKETESETIEHVTYSGFCSANFLVYLRAICQRMEPFNKHNFSQAYEWTNLVSDVLHLRFPLPHASSLC